MQTIENWSHVVGRVERWTPPKGPEAHGEVLVRVERVADVARGRGESWPNFLADAAGTALRVCVPASAARTLDLEAGAAVSLDVRRVKDPAVVYANPETIRVRRE